MNPNLKSSRCRQGDSRDALKPLPACDGVSRDRTIVLGLGNPILKDDGVGILVARHVEHLLAGREEVEIREASLAGFDLLDLLSGFRRAILIDAIKTSGGRPGDVYRLLPDQLPVTQRIAAMHEINLPTALALGRLMDMDMPEQIIIYAVEVSDNTTFGETLCPPVYAAVERVANCVVCEVLMQQ